MALAIDELVRKSTTTTTLAATIPQVWQPRVERNLRLHDVYLGSIVVNTDLMIPKAGNTVYIALLPDVGIADPLTEDVDMTPIALSTATTVPLTPAEYGKSVQITRAALDRISFDGIAEIIDRLSYSMALRVQSLVAKQWNQTVPGAGNGQSFVNQYPNGHNSATIVATDVMSDALILTAIAQLESTNNVPFEDGYYRLFITPLQYKQLIRDSDIRNDLRYASPERLLTNEKGALHGCRIITTNFQPYTGNAASDAALNIAAQNSVNVAVAFLMAPRAIALAWKRQPSVITDPTLYDGGRKRRFYVTADFAAVPLHFERMVCITTANV